MHKSFIVLVLILAGKIAMAQSPVGIWKNLDDTDGKEKSHIEIYEHKGKLRKNGNIWEGGQILDPKKGKIYDCKIEMDGKDKLNVRGFMGVSIFGRTQVWYKVK